MQGFEIDVWNEIAKRLDYEIEWETAGFPGIIELLDSGRVDTVADQIGITEERKRLIILQIRTFMFHIELLFRKIEMILIQLKISMVKNGSFDR